MIIAVTDYSHSQMNMNKVLYTMKLSSNTKPTITTTDLNKFVAQFKVLLRQRKELVVEIKESH